MSESMRSDMFLHWSIRNGTFEKEVLIWFYFIFFQTASMQRASGEMFNLITWILIGQCPARTPTTIERWNLLRMKSYLYRFSYTLGQKDLSTAQLLVVDRRLLCCSKAQQSSSKPQEANGSSMRSHFSVIDTEEPALASSSVLHQPAVPLWPGS